MAMLNNQRVPLKNGSVLLEILKTWELTFYDGLFMPYFFSPEGSKITPRTMFYDSFMRRITIVNGCFMIRITIVNRCFMIRITIVNGSFMILITSYNYD